MLTGSMLFGLNQIGVMALVKRARVSHWSPIIIILIMIISMSHCRSG